MNQVPAEIGFPVGQIFAFDFGLHDLEELRCGDVERLHRTEPHLGEILIPAEGRAERGQLLAGHLVVKVLGLATLDARERAFGQGGLNAHNGLRFLTGGLRLVAQQLKHLLHVRDVGLA